jgi:hypothetical protein
VGQAQVRRAAGQEPLSGLRQQALTASIDQPESLLAVESKNRHVDFSHHGAEERRGLKRPQALLPQGLAQRVDLEHDLAQSIITPRSASPDRIVTLSERREQIGQSLKRVTDSFLQGEGKTQPYAEN